MAENDSGSLTKAVDRLSGEIAGLRAETRELRAYGEQSRQIFSDLWAYVLTFPPAQKLTPEEKATRDAQIAQFKVYLARVLGQ